MFIKYYDEKTISHCLGVESLGGLRGLGGRRLVRPQQGVPLLIIADLLLGVREDIVGELN